MAGLNSTFIEEGAEDAEETLKVTAWRKGCPKGYFFDDWDEIMLI
jgi:hypothetical protein